MRAKVYLIGAGPGSPDLITRRGFEILRQADVVIYDYLVDERLLEEARQGARLICADQLGRRRFSDGFLPEQAKISARLVAEARRGRRVVRLKNGDPSLFGRLPQELETLNRHGIAYEIVPGVTAASAAAAFSGIPLTDRRFASSCVFVTGHEDPTKKKSFHNWEALAQCGTIVLYMAVERMDRIAERLIKAGRKKETPVVLIAGAATLNCRFARGTLADIAEKAGEAGIRPPAIAVIGDVATLEKEVSWFRRAKKVLFTGLSQERFFGEALFFHLPLIQIAPLEDYRAFDRELAETGGYDWLVFASRYGVQYFFQRLCAIGKDARIFPGAKVAAVGDSTRRKLLEYGITSDMTPKDESSRGLIAAFKKIGMAGKKIFMPRSDLADKGLTQGLAALGARVRAVVAYRNIMPKNLPDIDFSLFDEVMFSSPSGVRNFIKRYGAPPKDVKIRCIGHATASEARKHRLIG